MGPTDISVARRGVLALFAVVLGAVALHMAPAAAASADVSGLDPGLATSGSEPQAVIVTGIGNVADRVAAHGGAVTAELPFVHGVAALVRANELESLVAEPSVAAITADRAGKFSEYTYDESTTASNFTRTTQATAAWASGNLGQGVGVAVLDTGVSPMRDLDGRIVHGPDLSGEGTIIDSFGHGTVMAGIIAGNGADSADRVGGAYTGAAPAAHVVAVKVAGRNGVVDVSTMLQGMHWVAAYREQFNIRVLNLSWGVHSTQDTAIDPLNYAVQRLWDLGIVVVVAAGNDGSGTSTITKPADDPKVITVGALNDQGDDNPNNDGVTQFSSRGPTAAGLTKPDLVAPGRMIVSTRSFGSYISQTYPKAKVQPSYIRGSGTSQSAAVTSGVVALLLAARPELTPDGVKELLKNNAFPISNSTANVQGAGRLQLAAALSAVPVDAPQTTTATGLGSIEASRGDHHVVALCNDVETEIRGEIDVRCNQWDPATWTGVSWNGDAWTGVSWSGVSWNGVSWRGVSWSDATWDGVSWRGGTWTGVSWQGSSWTGASNPNSAWTGVSWSGSEWAGVSWAGVSWSHSEFTTGSYDEFLTAFWGNKPPPGKRVAGEPYTPRGSAENAGA
jgi:serine protease AprX